MSGSGYIASPADGGEILRILESSAAKGNIELLYTRRTDAYASYMKESGEARVFVSKNGERTVGTCAELIRDVYIGGRICRTAYLCGLKKDAEYTAGVGFGARFIRELHREDIGYYYCSVVSDNTDALSMFERSRRLLTFSPITSYKTHILNPRARFSAPRHSYTFRKAAEADRAPLLAFLQEEGRKKDLFPVISAPEQFYNLHLSDFYMLTEGDRILAAAALWDQTGYKQYVVKKYRGLMKCARAANPLLSLMGYIRLPREDAPLHFPMLSFFLSLEDSPLYYRIFLSEIKKEIAKDYGMFVIGLPTGHFAAHMLDSIPGIRFETKLCGMSFPWDSRDGGAPDPTRLQPECGLL